MPGLPFQQLPNTTPQSIMGDEFTTGKQQIVNRYNQQLKILRSTPMTTQNFNLQYSKLTQGFKTEIGQISQAYQKKNQQLQTIQSLVQQGSITSEKGEEAMWRTVLPQATEQAMFSKEATPATPYSVTYLESDKFQSSIEEFAVPARKTSIFKPWFMEKASQKDLLSQYQGWQDYIGYENLSPVRQRQVDIQWDDFMASKGWSEWNPNSPEVKAARSKGTLTKAAAMNITPMARSIVKSKQPQQIKQDPLGLR